MTAKQDELRAKAIALFDANFLDGDSLEQRANSRDMINVGEVLVYLDDYVLPLINSEVLAVLEELESKKRNPIALSGGERFKGGVIPLSELATIKERYM